MDELDRKYQQALTAARELLSVRSATLQEVLAQLQTLTEEIGMMIEGLHGDLVDEGYEAEES